MSIPQRIRYGAVELKDSYNRNLGKALGISIAAHIALIALYLVANTGKASSPVDQPPPVKQRPTTTSETFEILDDIAPPPGNALPAGGSPNNPGNATAVSPATTTSPATAVNPNPIMAASEPRPTTEFPDLQTVGSMNPLGNSGSNGGSGDRPGGFGGNGDGNRNGTLGGTKKNDAELPDESVFNADIELPNVDLKTIQSQVRYPEIALRNGIQGKVIVRVLVGPDGRALRTKIDYSEGKVLEAAALEAVRATIFSPGRLNGAPVAAWVSVPVIFKLEDR